MKNSIIKIGVGVLLLGTMSSCDLDTSPTTSLDAANAFKSTTYADDVMRGTWNNIFNDAWSYASVGLGSIMLNDDFMASDAVRARSYGFSSCYTITSGYSRDQYIKLFWDFTYDAINNCNGVIADIDKASGSESEKNRIKGQAYGTRGYMYLLLASHFSFAIDKDPDAVCVPIYTEPTTMDVALTGNPASSVKEVYEQALSDLKQAVALIPEDYSHGTDAIDQYKIDHNVALGLLARASLYARNWQDAYDNADKALKVNSYLMSEAEYKAGFNDCSNKEWMWGYSSTIDDNFPSYIFHFKDNTTDGSYYGPLCMDPNFMSNFGENDYRADLFQQWGGTPQSKSVIKLLNSKFKFKDVENDLGDIDLMRVSEMYLIKAEAAYHLGKMDEAKTALYTLQQARMKAGATAPEITATGEDLLKAIWMERRKELWGEGFGITDIIRNQQSVERKKFEKDMVINGKEVTGEGHTTLKFNDGTDFCVNSKYYLYRIPQSEELQNENLYKNHQKLDFYR